VLAMFNCKGYGGRGRLRWDSCSKGSRERDPLEPLLSRQRRLTRTRDGAVENQRPTPRFHDPMSSAVAKALVPKVRRDGTDLQEMTPVTGVLVESERDPGIDPVPPSAIGPATPLAPTSTVEMHPRASPVLNWSSCHLASHLHMCVIPRFC